MGVFDTGNLLEKRKEKKRDKAGAPDISGSIYRAN